MQSEMNRREFIKALGFGAASLAFPVLKCRSIFAADSKKKKPNFVIILADDLGYGDLGCYGHPTIRTPNLDRMAVEGQKWTDFYAADSVCTPSRAALLTGRLPVRSGMCNDEEPRVLFPYSAGGLPQSEITIAEALKPAGYKSACIGKWHLGHLPQYLPTNNGFDYFFGLPYSNDMDCKEKRAWTVEGLAEAKVDWFNVPLMRNEEIIERPAEQHTLTKRYTEEAVKFIRQNKDKPFFLYFPHTFPHTPLFASKDFEDKSRRGIYGDVVEELDWSVGQILKTLKGEGVADNTFVVFTSDNGPWLRQERFGGSAGPLRDGKGTTWEGGMREPCIMYWPGKIKPAVINDMGSMLDLLPTICALTGAKVPTDRVLDGYDLSSVLFGKGSSPRNVMFYHRGRMLYAVRKGLYKAHFFTRPGYLPKNAESEATKHDPPLLYDLGQDPSENFDVAAKHHEIIADIKKEAERHLANMIPGENQLIKRLDLPK